MHGALSRRRAGVGCDGAGSPLLTRSGFPKVVLNGSISFFDLVHAVPLEKAMRGTSGVGPQRPKPSTTAARAHWLGRWK